jgi:hypothetical protein
MAWRNPDDKRAYDRAWIAAKRGRLRAQRRRDSEAYLRSQVANPTDAGVEWGQTAEEWRAQCEWMLSLTPAEDIEI